MHPNFLRQLVDSTNSVYLYDSRNTQVGQQLKQTAEVTTFVYYSNKMTGTSRVGAISKTQTAQTF